MLGFFRICVVWRAQFDTVLGEPNDVKSTHSFFAVLECFVRRLLERA
jgi:hypothetical protein